MRVIDEYGLRSASMDTARLAVEAALGVRFDLHESLFWGGEYYRADISRAQRVTIRRNLNSFTQKLTDPEHADHAVLVTVTEPTDPEQTRASLANATPPVEFLSRFVIAP